MVNSITKKLKGYVGLFCVLLVGSPIKQVVMTST